MKLGRNDPCSCGSGKKYKSCCLGKVEFQPPRRSAPTSAELNMLDFLYSNRQFAELEFQASVLIGQYPNSGSVWKLYGLALQMQGKYSLPALKNAADLLPNDAEAHGNLAAALRAAGELEGAVEGCRRALKIKPGFAEAHNTLGVALKGLFQFDPAIACFQRALELKPGFAEAHNNLGDALKNIGQLDAALASFRRALETRPDFVEAHSNLLFVLNYTAGYSPAYCLEQARQYGRVVAGKAGARFSAWQCSVRPERLRVGMVSGDLCTHSVGHFLEGLLANIDPGRIELIAYPTQDKEDNLTARIRPFFSAWKPLLGMSDEASARMIHSDGVHVLFDLSGHTAHNRLPVFAWKPAPVQVTWLGLPATTGVVEMDYILADPYSIPAEHENHFTETVWRMPESCLCLTVPDYQGNVAPLPALSAGYITFGSFNNLAKMSDAVVSVWARVLKLVPGSRLMLKTSQLNDPAVCEKTGQRFASCGIASERLLLFGTLTSRDDHLAMYNKVDIAFDTFPYPGVTTSAEALWMGVPVLSLQGDRFLSRTAGSIAINAGLPGWIAADEDDYVAKAVSYADDLETLAALRTELRQKVEASPLFNILRFSRDFEDALWSMWKKYQIQQEISA